MKARIHTTKNPSSWTKITKTDEVMLKSAHESRTVIYRGERMQQHVATFLLSRWLWPHDPVTCEICNKRKANDVMHVEWRIGENYDDALLLIAGCRECHQKYDLGHQRSPTQLKNKVNQILKWIEFQKRLKNIQK